MDAIDRLLAYLGVQNALRLGEEIVEVMQNLLISAFDVYGNVTLLQNETASLEAKLTTLRTEYAQALGNVSNCSHWDPCKTLNVSLLSISMVRAIRVLVI